MNRALIRSQPQVTHQGPREVASTADAYYFVNLQLAGRCGAHQGPDASIVEPGQFVVVDTTRPFHFDNEWQVLPSGCPTSSCGRGWLDGHHVPGWAWTARAVLALQ